MNTARIERACWLVPVSAILIFASTGCSANPTTSKGRDQRSPLHLERTIPLPNVHGRIDHMALDSTGTHLFVAEFGNGSVDDVDLTSATVVAHVSGLHEPQGVAWLPSRDEVAVACGDGTVHFYRSSDLREIARLSLGDDADNVRLDSRNGNLVVGYGSGALAVIDPSTHHVLRTVKLPAHPEAFELLGSTAFLNVPDAHEILLADLDAAHVTKILGTGAHFGNYPMASDTSGSRIAIGFRRPSLLSVLDVHSAKEVFSAPICGDADDLYFHAGELVVVCGEGAVELVDIRARHSIVRVATQNGARTGLLYSRRNRLFVGVPAGKGSAAIWELSFQPGSSQAR